MKNLKEEDKKTRKEHQKKMFEEFKKAIPYMDKEDFEDLIEELEEYFDSYNEGGF